jgi:hypothetical protein
VPIQPSKGQKKTTRPFTRESNLTDLLGTDIFGGAQNSGEKVKKMAPKNQVNRRVSVKEFPG